VAQTSVCGVPINLGSRADIGHHADIGLRWLPGNFDGTPQTEVCATEIQKSFLAGSIRFEIAAETVKIGSFTTWLSRRFMATLHSR
jgi:hypothetical protein